jgi:hypothetical protein
MPCLPVRSTPQRADKVEYQVAGANADGGFAEAGEVTKYYAVIANDTETKESEVVTVTAIISEDEARKLVAETGLAEDQPPQM